MKAEVIAVRYRIPLSESQSAQLNRLAYGFVAIRLSRYGAEDIKYGVRYYGQNLYFSLKEGVSPEPIEEYLPRLLGE